MKTFQDQDVDRAFNQAPIVVQHFITEGEIVPIFADIGKKWGLHADQLGKAVELNRNMMLGLITPQEFAQGLTEMGIEQMIAQDIVQTINQKIFAPLREKIKSATNAPSEGSVERQFTPEQTPRPATPPPMSRPVESTTPPVPAVPRPPSAAPAGRAPGNEGVSIPPPPSPNRAQIGGGTPMPLPPREPASSRPLPSDTAALPPRVVLPGSNVHVPPPINRLEGRVLPLPISGNAAPPSPAPKPQSTAPRRETPITYGADPYREPPEESK